MQVSSPPTTNAPPSRTLSTGRRVLMVGLAFALLAVTLHSVDLRQLPANDFLEYWAAARLDVAGENPYSPAALLALERQAGLNSDKPLMMWNPPWSLPFIVPFGLLSLGTARALVFVFTFLIVFGCADWLWRFYGGAPQRRWIAWGLTCSFAPAMVCVASGQIAPLVLLGLALFLYWKERALHFPAGAAILLISFKPHLLYLLWVLLAWWIIRNRCWKLALGAFGAIGGSTCIAAAINTVPVTHYWAAWSSNSPLALYAPPLGGLLRVGFGWQRHWLQFVPAIMALAWCAWWYRKGPALTGRGDLPLLLLVSVCTSPYGWLFDQVVLLPALLKRAAEFGRLPRGHAIAALILYTAANVAIAVMVLTNFPLLSLYYAWAAPLWLMLYSATAPRSSVYSQ
jgi:hypothetical protein